MTTDVMFDSITTADIPGTGSQYVAGYVNGRWPNASENAKRFGNTKRLVTIDVLGNQPSADVLDVEPGNVGVDGAVKWVTDKLKLGHEYLPIIYCNRSTLTPLFNAMLAAGHKINEHFKIWIATLDGTKTVEDMTGVVAVQWAGESQTGGHYDASVVYDVTWKAPAGKQLVVGETIRVPWLVSAEDTLEGLASRFEISVLHLQSILP